MTPMDGLSTRLTDTILTRRACELLGNGPADAVALIEHVCQLPGAPRVVAEQMAFALFAGRPEFTRDAAGQWSLAPRGAAIAAARAAVRAVAADAPAPPAAAAPDRDELGELSWVVVDTETTGMRAWHGDRITEVAAVVVRNGVVCERFETLVNPERPIPRMITALTHIDAAMVRTAPVFGDVCDELLRMLEGHVFVAHNVEFDWRFLSAELVRARGRRLVGRKLCTVRLARRVLPYLRSRRLDSLARYYDIEITDRHRAGGDAHATAHVLLRLLDQARALDCTRWNDLEQLVAAPRRGRRRRGRRSSMPRWSDGWGEGQG
ncbi:MAG TPA: 3'-5' exonuclease [Gemmatimonadaceae bacterium]|nr:3'-5' exonuclease [Gemmatimonadaceae bacterium]